MSPILPTDYALSELLVAAASWAGVAQLAGRGSCSDGGALAPLRLAAIGLVPFGLAGLVGAVQIAGGFSGAIVAVHQALARPGTVLGLCCLIGALARLGTWQTLAVGGVLAVMAAAIPAVGVPLFVGLVLAGAALAFRVGAARRGIGAAGFAVLLGAQLLSGALRPAHPALAWHLFHALVALWLLIVAAIIRRALRPATCAARQD